MYMMLPNEKWRPSTEITEFEDALFSTYQFVRYRGHSWHCDDKTIWSVMNGWVYETDGDELVLIPGTVPDNAAQEKLWHNGGIDAILKSRIAKDRLLAS